MDTQEDIDTALDLAFEKTNGNKFAMINEFRVLTGISLRMASDHVVAYLNKKEADTLT